MLKVMPNCPQSRFYILLIVDYEPRRIIPKRNIKVFYSLLRPCQPATGFFVYQRTYAFIHGCLFMCVGIHPYHKRCAKKIIHVLREKKVLREPPQHNVKKGSCNVPLSTSKYIATWIHVPVNAQASLHICVYACTHMLACETLETCVLCHAIQGTFITGSCSSSWISCRLIVPSPGDDVSE